MKKVSCLIFCGLIIFVISSQNSQAMVKPVSFYINGGVITDDSFSFDPFQWTAGAIIDISIPASPIMISPECHIIVTNFDFNFFTLAPAVLVNFKFSSLFVGAGITKWWPLGSEAERFEASDFLLKINAGLKGVGVRLTAFLITEFDSLFEYNTIGATLGFGF